MGGGRIRQGGIGLHPPLALVNSTSVLRCLKKVLRVQCDLSLLNDQHVCNSFEWKRFFTSGSLLVYESGLLR